MSELPSGPWKELASDFYGSLPSGEYILVLVDEYTRYPVVEIITSISANCVIPVLDKTFALFEICEVLKTDNGPPHNSGQFRLFAEYIELRHRQITPYWPEANGEYERFMRCFGKVLRAAIIEGKAWKQDCLNLYVLIGQLHTLVQICHQAMHYLEEVFKHVSQMLCAQILKHQTLLQPIGGKG